MDSWREAFREEIKDWLLEESNPSVRYFTLVNLLGRPEDDDEVRNAKKNIMINGAIPGMLGIMRSGDYAAVLPNFYTAKYKGLVWQLIILAELGADGDDEEIKSYCEYLLEHSQEKETGAFSIETSVKYGGGRKSMTIPCLTGNMIFALTRLGYSQDERVVKAAKWLAERQRYDDGDGPRSDRAACWGDHSCYMGAVKALKGFAELPPGTRSAEVRESIERGARFLLKHHIYKQSHDLTKPLKPGWMKFSFPLMYQTDALEMLLILCKLGVRDERMSEAADLVAAKCGAQGRWMQESTYGGKFLKDIEPKGPSKWITLRALEALKSYYPD